MKKVFKVTSVWTAVFLLMSCLQMMVQGMAINDVYNFEQYTIVGWVFQSLYWVLSFSFGATVALYEDDNSL